MHLLRIRNQLPLAHLQRPIAPCTVIRFLHTLKPASAHATLNKPIRWLVGMSTRPFAAQGARGRTWYYHTIVAPDPFSRGHSRIGSAPSHSVSNTIPLPHSLPPALAHAHAHARTAPGQSHVFALVSSKQRVMYLVFTWEKSTRPHAASMPPRAPLSLAHCAALTARARLTHSRAHRPPWSDASPCCVVH